MGLSRAHPSKPPDRFKYQNAQNAQFAQNDVFLRKLRIFHFPFSILHCFLYDAANPKTNAVRITIYEYSRIYAED